MLHVNHIHRPALERYARQKYGTLRDVAIQVADDSIKYEISLCSSKVQLNLFDDPEVFEHKVHIDRYGMPWFTRAGCGKESRSYAENHNETCLISAEIETQKGNFRKLISFVDNQAFLDYYKNCNEKHLYECILPNTPCLLFTDHDQLGGVSELHKHQVGVRETDLTSTFKSLKTLICFD